MCKAAKEIQELWKPKPGDNIFDDMLIKGIIKEFKDDGISLTRWKDGKYCRADNLYWKPRQEDLQAIYMNINSKKLWSKNVKRRFVKNRADVTIMGSFFEWFCHNDEVLEQSFNHMWLCFVMETCFNKQWDSEKEEWVPI